MSGLFATISASASSLAAFETALEVTQNNVANANTPGYAAQNVDFHALSFDAESGLAGGVTATVSTTQDPYADAAVRQQLSAYGTAQQLSTTLGNLQTVFDVTGTTGAGGSLNQLFSSFSALSTTPSDSTARQNVLTAAQSVASAFQATASALSSASGQAETQIQSQVAQINSLTQQIQDYNIQRQQSPAPDPGLDAKITDTVEQLSQIANVSVTTGLGGTTTVLLNGQTPLVLGAQQFSLHVGHASTGQPPAVQIQDQSGNDVTAQVAQGSLAGLLQVRNTTIPSIIGDGIQAGSLNTLAKNFADRVNTLLTSGQISAGPPPVSGIPLFTYDGTSVSNTAQTLAVNLAITASQIATIDPGPPAVSNGIATKLAALSSGSSATDQVNGLSYTAFYGQIAAGVGSALTSAKDDADTRQQAVNQARSLRSQLSGVSLDAEAAKLIQFQRAYDATTKLVTVLDQITQSTLNLLQ